MKILHFGQYEEIQVVLRDQAFIWLEVNDTMRNQICWLQLLNPALSPPYRNAFDDLTSRLGQVLDSDHILKFQRSCKDSQHSGLIYDFCPVSQNNARLKLLFGEKVQVIAICHGLFEMLHRAHSQQVYIGSFSEEFLVEKKGGIAFSGFGYAALLAVDKQFNVGVGIAPEIKLGKPLTPASDVYSLTLLLGQLVPQLKATSWYAQATEQDQTKRFQTARLSSNSLKLALASIDFVAQHNTVSVPANKVELAPVEASHVEVDEGEVKAAEDQDENLTPAQQEERGRTYQYGIGMAKNLQLALYWYHKAAVRGDINAQFSLGNIYANDSTIENHKAKAFHWYEKSATQGHAGAQNNLGLIYQRGLSNTAALYWYYKSSHQNSDAAQRNFDTLMRDLGKQINFHSIGVACCDGILVPRDHEQAVFWFHKSGSIEQYRQIAHNGNADAQYFFGRIYEAGLSVSQDYSEAVKFYTRAAQNGHSEAQNRLAIMYYYGHGVTRDLAKAIFWFQKAANQGNMKAQFNLASMYYNAIGVKKDESNAVYWYQKAADQGYTDAKEALKWLK
jgi:TPR repeat protein